MCGGRIGVGFKKRMVRALTGQGRVGSELSGKRQCVRPSQGEVRAGRAEWAALYSGTGDDAKSNGEKERLKVRIVGKSPGGLKALWRE